MAPRKIDRDSRRHQILEAAAVVFAQHGYRRATIEQVADAAGISKGAIYLSFGSKEDLFYDLLDLVTRESIAAAVQAADEAAGAVAGIRALFEGVMDGIDANPAMVPLTLEFWSACGPQETRERFSARFAQLFAEFRGVLAALIRRGIKDGELPRGWPARDLASCLMAMIDGLLLQQWTDPGFDAAAALRRALPALLGNTRGTAE